ILLENHQQIDACALVLRNEYPAQSFPKLSAYIIKLGGYSVVTATDPNTAITLAKRQRPDLVIVDYEMPVMNGCTLADRLRVIMPRLHTILYSGPSTFQIATF
ncbi:MAG TPA: response regulator, partial [Edaphobacter sp.]|nr:response regulator [Edaphobacter sp.]